MDVATVVAVVSTVAIRLLTGLIACASARPGRVSPAGPRAKQRAAATRGLQTTAPGTVRHLPTPFDRVLVPGSGRCQPLSPARGGGLSPGPSRPGRSATACEGGRRPASMALCPFGGGVMGNTTGSGPVVGGSSPPPSHPYKTKPQVSGLGLLFERASGRRFGHKMVTSAPEVQYRQSSMSLSRYRLQGATRTMMVGGDLTLRESRRCSPKSSALGPSSLRCAASRMVRRRCRWRAPIVMEGVPPTTPAARSWGLKWPSGPAPSPARAALRPIAHRAPVGSPASLVTKRAGPVPKRGRTSAKYRPRTKTRLSKSGIQRHGPDLRRLCQSGTCSLPNGPRSRWTSATSKRAASSERSPAWYKVRANV